MVRQKIFQRTMKAANRYAKTHRGEIVGFEPTAHGHYLVDFEFPEFDIRVGGRLYKVEKVEATEAENGTGLGVAYRLTGLKGAEYMACRNAKRPEFLFVMPTRLAPSNVFERVWLTDRGGTLQEVS